MFVFDVSRYVRTTSKTNVRHLTIGNVDVIKLKTQYPSQSFSGVFCGLRLHMDTYQVFDLRIRSCDQETGHYELRHSLKTYD